MYQKSKTKSTPHLSLDRASHDLAEGMSKKGAGSTPVVAINLVVHNGEKYIRRCLDSVLEQIYPRELIELNILDNNSTDLTAKMIENFGFRISDFGFAKFSSLKSEKNLGMWPGQELLLEQSHGKYIVVLSVDVILHPDFIKNAIEAMEQDEKIGALQAKVYKYDINSLLAYGLTSLRTGVIDTLGFQIFKSRRIVNIGHGEEDRGQYDKPEVTGYRLQVTGTAKICCKQIFAVEGAVPVFRCEALEDCRLQSQASAGLTCRSSGGLTFGDFLRSNLGKIIDPDFFWYGDDLDLAWRMRIFGWKQVYAPSVIAWHDRKTTKSLAGDWREFVKIRKTLPMFKRRLDWRNTVLAIIKNDFAANWLRDLPWIFWRQIQMWAYFMIFEPVMILEIFNVAKMLPKMLKRRKEIMRKAKMSPKDFRRWLT